MNGTKSSSIWRPVTLIAVIILVVGILIFFFTDLKNKKTSVNQLTGTNAQQQQECIGNAASEYDTGSSANSAQVEANAISKCKSEYPN